MTELRADARRNRAELLDVARQVIREQGVDASLRDIARRADVGIATLYRHFPTREDLIAAIISDGIRWMNAQAAVLAELRSPGDALCDWLADMAARIGPYHGLPAMLDAVDSDGSPLRALCAEMEDTGHQLLSRAQAGGAVRPDVDWPDVFTAIRAISAISIHGGPDARDRVLRVYLDGLSVRPA